MTATTEARIQPYEVMVVDDAAASLEYLMDILKQRRYRVRPAASGSIALRSAALKPPDLILMDVRMPGMDGYEVCRRLKSDRQTADIPVIFVSVADSTSCKMGGFEAGGVDYITKPFVAEEMLARVQTHLRLRQVQVDLERSKELAEEQVRQCTAELRKADVKPSESQS